jgi:hypothetical protein
MNEASGRPSLGERRSEGEYWAIGPHKRAKACHSSESDKPRLCSDTREYLIEARSPGNGDRTVSTLSGTSPESNNRVSRG